MPHNIRILLTEKISSIDDFARSVKKLGCNKK
jgi:hypothetical protein